jgi:hypothetical protein
MASWQGFQEACARCRDSGRALEFWWRDDDAQHRAPALEKLLELSARFQVPLALAVIPVEADPDLLAGLGDHVQVLQHGADHCNRAAAGEKKSEFPDAEPTDEAMRRLGKARMRLESLAGGRFVPVLAPPWNRFPDGLAHHLVSAGYRGLSRYGARHGGIPGLREVNTHVDIIAWRGDRAFIGEDAALEALLLQLSARSTSSSNAPEPIGLLTHHAVHDNAAWQFIERLLETTSATKDLHWRSAKELFHL